MKTDTTQRFRTWRSWKAYVKISPKRFRIRSQTIYGTYYAVLEQKVCSMRHEKDLRDSSYEVGYTRTDWTIVERLPPLTLNGHWNAE